MIQCFQCLCHKINTKYKLIKIFNRSFTPSPLCNYGPGNVKWSTVVYRKWICCDHLKHALLWILNQIIMIIVKGVVEILNHSWHKYDVGKSCWRVGMFFHPFFNLHCNVAMMYGMSLAYACTRQWQKSYFFCCSQLICNTIQLHFVYSDPWHRFTLPSLSISQCSMLQ